MPKAMTLRLSEEQATALEATARVDGIAVSEAVRDAIDSHIQARREDSEFRGRVRKIMQDDQRVFERLAAS